VVAISQCLITGRKTFFITRFLLGLLEGQVQPHNNKTLTETWMLT
jgi:hypothetical protein